MKDVAAYRGRGLLFSALLPLAIGLVGAGVAGVVPFFIASEAARGGGGSWGLLIVMIFPSWIGWVCLSGAWRRIRASGEKDCYLRAGPDGLALRVPGPATRASAGFAYTVWEYQFRWDEVSSLTWSLESGSSRNLVVTARGGTLEIEGVWFVEPVTRILENIRSAAAPVQPPIQQTTL